MREYGEDVFMPAMLHLRPNSADTYASHLKNHVYPALGDKKMAEVTRTMVQSFVALVSGKVAASTTESATITETMDTYGHLFPDAEDLGRGVIDTVFSTAQDSLTELQRNQEAQ